MTSPNPTLRRPRFRYWRCPCGGWLKRVKPSRTRVYTCRRRCGYAWAKD